MGTFYGNVLVARPCQEVVPLLSEETAAGRPAIRGYALAVGPRHTVIHPAEETEALTLAEAVSRRLSVPTLGMYVFDSDVLVMQVYEDGELRHVYDSWPGYFSTERPADAWSSDAAPSWPEPLGAAPTALLPFAAAPVDIPALESVLRCVPLAREDGKDGRYVFADAQHYDVMALLGLSAPRLNTGYGALSQGYLPPGTALTELWLLGGATFWAGGAPAGTSGV
ncbi:hypothetical protein [Streptomyces sp. 4F14]|uniref:hypothetical protein n=1 Tax=Streptomyces sp. 4F14 TaxID=3394380 RepID=UPI003A84BDD0